MNYVKMLLVCFTLCFCSGALLGTTLVITKGLSDWQKREHLFKLRQKGKQFQYNNPAQPDSYVNDPERFWYS